MSTLFVVPSILPAYTDECLATIDPELPLLVIDNTVTNMGVPRSWNLGIATARERGHSHVALVSAGVHFGRLGGLDVAHLHGEHEWGFHSQEGWHLAVVSLKLIDRVGTFDENFFPGYYEDTDYVRRMWLASQAGPPIAWPLVQVDARTVHTAHAVRHAGVELDDEPERYYERKWGVSFRRPYEEHWEHPFNNPAVDWTWWRS